MEIKLADTYSIVDILDQLSCVSMNGEIRAEIISSLCIYMRKSVRHNYHEITKYVMKKFSKIDESETIQMILYNIDIIIDYIKSVWACEENHLLAPRDCLVLDHGECKLVIESYGIKCSEWKALYRFVIKLKDHIYLEFIRLAEIREQEATINAELHRLEESEESLKRMECELRASIGKATKETKNIYLQMVSILGIFTAIVIAVFGGLSVVSGILDGLSMVTLEDRKNVLFSVALVIAFVIDIIFILVVLIGNMQDLYKPPKWISFFVLTINACCLVAVLYSINIIGAQEMITRGCRINGKYR